MFENTEWTSKSHTDIFLQKYFQIFDANMSVNHLYSYLHLISFHVVGYHSVMWGSAPRGQLYLSIVREPSYAPLFLIVNLVR